MRPWCRRHGCVPSMRSTWPPRWTSAHPSMYSSPMTRFSSRPPASPVSPWHSQGGRTDYCHARSERCYESLHSLVDGAEGVFAQHGALGLVVELEVYPVDGE